VFASGFPAEGVEWRDIVGSFYNSLGMPLAEQRVVPSPRPVSGWPPGGRGAYAICALPDLCLGLVRQGRA
jgi:hypothetical protein